MSLPIFDIYKLKTTEENNKIPGFMVVSTAPVNVEADPAIAKIKFEKDNPDLELIPDLDLAIKEISATLSPQKDTELLIAVHGYNTTRKSVKEWYQDILKFINTDSGVNKIDKNLVFVGYRWPSESVGGDNEDGFWVRLKSVWHALPILPQLLIQFSGLGYLGILGALVWFININRLGVFILVLLAGLFTFSLASIFSLVILRTTGYFRDTYRSANYGVPDLVELIRQIDKQVFAGGQGKNILEKSSFWNRHRIGLSFLAHSMGGQVVTSTVRILSDVFESNSVGSLQTNSVDKQPDNFVGNIYKLGRLILVSPDIPVDTLMQGRANFLNSSIRRFEESYLFSNEGDLALRLGSTASNYFSFPANTRNHGYRLGNIAVSKGRYGIVNMDSISTEKALDLTSYLKIGYAKDSTNLLNLWKELLHEDKLDNHILATKFCYVDCTDYQDVSKFPKEINSVSGLLSFAKRKEYLGFWDYLSLTLNYLTGKKDVHGGYFSGDFSRKMIYRIFAGDFEYFLKSLSPMIIKHSSMKQEGLQVLDMLTQKNGIQIVLPEKFL